MTSEYVNDKLDCQIQIHTYTDSRSKLIEEVISDFPKLGNAAISPGKGFADLYCTKMPEPVNGNDDALTHSDALRRALGQLKMIGLTVDEQPLPVYSPDDHKIKFKTSPNDWVSTYPIDRCGLRPGEIAGQRGDFDHPPAGMILVGTFDVCPPIPIWGPDIHKGDSRYDPVTPPLGQEIVGFIDTSPPIPIFGPIPKNPIKAL